MSSDLAHSGLSWRLDNYAFQQDHVSAQINNIKKIPTFTAKTLEEM